MDRLVVALAVAAMPAVACRATPPATRAAEPVPPAEAPRGPAPARTPCHPDRDHAIAAELLDAAVIRYHEMGACRSEGEHVIDEDGRVVATIEHCAGIEVHVPGFRAHESSTVTLPVGDPVTRLHALATPDAPLVCRTRADGRWCAFEDGVYAPDVRYRVRAGVVVSAFVALACD
jgi:hypothetical protein